MLFGVVIRTPTTLPRFDPPVLVPNEIAHHHVAGRSRSTDLDPRRAVEPKHVGHRTADRVPRRIRDLNADLVVQIVAGAIGPNQVPNHHDPRRATTADQHSFNPAGTDHVPRARRRTPDRVARRRDRHANLVPQTGSAGIGPDQVAQQPVPRRPGPRNRYPRPRGRAVAEPDHIAQPRGRSADRVVRGCDRHADPVAQVRPARVGPDQVPHHRVARGSRSTDLDPRHAVQPDHVGHRTADRVPRRIRDLHPNLVVQIVAGRIGTDEVAHHHDPRRRRAGDLNARRPAGTNQVARSAGRPADRVARRADRHPDLVAQAGTADIGPDQVAHHLVARCPGPRNRHPRPRGRTVAEPDHITQTRGRSADRVARGCDRHADRVAEAGAGGISSDQVADHHDPVVAPPLIWIPAVPLFPITLPPLIVLLDALTATPIALPRLAPVLLVPIRLPTTRFPVVAAPLIETPAEFENPMMLAAPVDVPPIVLLALAITTPEGFPRLLPLAFVPDQVAQHHVACPCRSRNRNSRRRVEADQIARPRRRPTDRAARTPINPDAYLVARTCRRSGHVRSQVAQLHKVMARLDVDSRSNKVVDIQPLHRAEVGARSPAPDRRQ